MSHYADLIARQTGTDDPAMAALIEEIMRTERTALDGLTPAQFDAAIIEACDAAAELAADGQIAWYCGVLGLQVPSAFAAA